MTTQPSKLYRSNVNYMPVTVLPPKDLNLTHDFQIDSKFKRDYSNKNTLASTGSQAHLKSKNLNQSIEATKQTMPYAKDAQNTSFMSIDDAYLSPKFQKKKDFTMNRILPKNITDLQSDTDSIGGRSIRTHQGQDDYYKYWKTKAHEYLEENFKLREENQKLKTEMDNMRVALTKQLNQSRVDQEHPCNKQREDKSFLYLEGIFKKKLDELENLLTEKSLKITTLQDQVLELNRKVLGEQERTELLERLGTQIETLSHENILLKMQLSQTDSQPQSQKSIEAHPAELGMRHRYRSKEKIYGSGRKQSVERSGRK